MKRTYKSRDDKWEKTDQSLSLHTSYIYKIKVWETSAKTYALFCHWDLPKSTMHKMLESEPNPITHNKFITYVYGGY